MVSPKSDGFLGVPFIIGSSIASSVVLIVVNKRLMQDFHFSYIFTLTGMHFLFGGLALTFVSKVLKSFEIKLMSSDQALLVAASGVSSICFMNFSLQANTVGTYQLMKLVVIPLVMAIQYFTDGALVTRKVGYSIIALLFGVGLSTINDISLTLWGFIAGVLSVVCTAQFNIWQGTKQKEHGLTSVQLLHAISFHQAGLCFLLALYFDGVGATVPITEHPFVESELWFIALSCVVAMGVNLSSMGIIGKTSAVTYQVVGHAKTCLILLFGYLMFPSTMDTATFAKNMAGVGIALAGVFAYTYFKLNNL